MMIIEDMPCDAPCERRSCTFNRDGLCADNATCEERKEAKE